MKTTKAERDPLPWPMDLDRSTGSSRVDSALLNLIATIDERVPGRVLALFVLGSYADGTEVETSDVDVTIVVRDAFVSPGEAATIETCRFSSSGGLELDLEVVDERSLRGGITPTLAQGSRLIWGQDVRERLPLMPVEEWARGRMHAAYWLVMKVFHRPLPARIPLPFPRAEDEFYGYLERTVRLPDGTERPSTRNLVRVTGWAATALLANQTGTVVARKSDCHRLYRQQLGGGFAPLLSDIYELCRTRWGYLIPAGEEERRALRDLCRLAREFEEHFLRAYREFLLMELRHADPRRAQDARRLLEEVPFDDGTVLEALRKA